MRLLAGEWKTSDAASIIVIEIVNASNKTSIVGKAAWGILGGALLGPVGALAGVIGGGRSTDLTVSVKSIDREALLSVSKTEYEKLLVTAAEAAFKAKANDAKISKASTEEAAIWRRLHRSALERLGEEYEAGTISKAQFERDTGIENQKLRDLN